LRAARAPRAEPRRGRLQERRPARRQRITTLVAWPSFHSARRPRASRGTAAPATPRTTARETSANHHPRRLAVVFTLRAARAPRAEPRRGRLQERWPARRQRIITLVAWPSFHSARRPRASRGTAARATPRTMARETSANHHPRRLAVVSLCAPPARLARNRGAGDSKNDGPRDVSESSPSSPSRRFHSARRPRAS